MLAINVYGNIPGQYEPQMPPPPDAQIAAEWEQACHSTLKLTCGGISVAAQQCSCRQWSPRRAYIFRVVTPRLQPATADGIYSRAWH